MPRGLFARSLLIIVAPLVLLQVIATWAFFDQHLSTVSRRLAQAVAGDIAVAIQLWNGAKDDADRQAALDQVGSALWMPLRFEPDAILSNEGNRRSSYVSRTMADAVREMVRRPAEIDDTNGERVHIAVQLPNGILHANVSRKRLFSASAYAFVLWMVGSSFILLTVAGLFMRNQIRPVQRLADAAERFGKGQGVGAFKPEGALEIRRASIEFLRMRERIQRQIHQRTEMLAGVSHDLRTPLTRLKLELAMLGASNDLEAAKADLVEMEGMLDAYLAFVRGEGGEESEEVDLVDLIQDLAAAYRRSGGEITLDLPESLRMVLRPMAIGRAITNLVGNAGKYARRSVVLSVQTQGGSALIHVDDDGPGIPEHQIEEVFRPFRRLSEARTLDGSASVGLGLTITRDLVRGHGGDVLLGKSPLGGLRATIRLPL
ncbi:ATP-binding protein [Lacibacterium aquatile]|uniref:histidine kinase n=1 Tax=Lacibacterium aquatile TaxID=1168082 RepID=A0ABW5DTN6_9PROT